MRANAGIEVCEVPERYRINGLKRADLIIKHSRNGKFRHDIEFKRGVKAIPFHTSSVFEVKWSILAIDEDRQHAMGRKVTRRRCV